MSLSELPTLQEIKNHKIFGKVLTDNFMPKSGTERIWNKIIEDSSNAYFEINGAFLKCHKFTISSYGWFEPRSYNVFSHAHLRSWGSSKIELLSAFADVMKIEAIILRNHKLNITIIEGRSDVKKNIKNVYENLKGQEVYLVNNHQVLSNFKSNLLIFSSMGFSRENSKHTAFEYSRICFNALKLREIMIFSINAKDSNKYVAIQDIYGWDDAMPLDAFDITSFLNNYGNNSIAVVEIDGGIVNGYSYVNISSENSYANLIKNLKKGKMYIGIAFDLAFYYNLDSVLLSYSKYNSHGQLVLTKNDIALKLRESMYG